MLPKIFGLILFCMAKMAVAQEQVITYPYNPDSNDDGFIETLDLLDLLGIYSSPFVPSELFIDGTSLGEILINFESLIQNGFYEGSSDGDFLRWNEEDSTWQTEQVLSNLKIQDVEVQGGALFLSGVIVESTLTAQNVVVQQTLISENLNVTNNAIVGGDLTSESVNVTQNATVIGSLTVQGDLLPTSMKLAGNPTSTDSNDPNSYPLVVQGGNQGVLIAIEREDGNNNTAVDADQKYVTFANGSPMDNPTDSPTWYPKGSIHGNPNVSELPALFNSVVNLLNGNNVQASWVPSCPWDVSFTNPDINTTDSLYQAYNDGESVPPSSYLIVGVQGGGENALPSGIGSENISSNTPNLQEGGGCPNQDNCWLYAKLYPRDLPYSFGVPENKLISFQFVSDDYESWCICNPTNEVQEQFQCTSSQWSFNTPTCLVEQDIVVYSCVGNTSPLGESGLPPAADCILAAGGTWTSNVIGTECVSFESPQPVNEFANTLTVTNSAGYQESIFFAELLEASNSCGFGQAKYLSNACPDLSGSNGGTISSGGEFNSQGTEASGQASGQGSISIGETLEGFQELSMLIDLVFSVMWTVESFFPPGLLFDFTDLLTSIVNTTFKSIDVALHYTIANENLGVSYSSGSADYAEWLPKADLDEQFFVGDIVGVNRGSISKTFDKADHYMVISKAPVVLGNTPEKGENPKDFEKVAFLGQVEVKVAGMVKAGDYVIANEAGGGIGYAKPLSELNEHEFNRIVGVAWEDASSEKRVAGIQLVKTAVGLNRNDLIHEMQHQNHRLNVLESTLKTMIASSRIGRTQQGAELLSILNEGTSSANELLKNEMSRKSQHDDFLSYGAPMHYESTFHRVADLTAFDSESREIIAKEIEGIILKDYGINLEDDIPLLHKVMHDANYARDVHVYLSNQLGLWYDELTPHLSKEQLDGLFNRPDKDVKVKEMVGDRK